jgi:hypothetical protein
MEIRMAVGNTVKGMIAGFVATIVLSGLMLTKEMMGLMPQLDVIGMLTTMMGVSSPVAGWITHFAIGTIAWGGLFAILEANLPGDSYWQRGIVFGIGAWVLMMVAVMPMAGAGMFGLGLGVMAPVMTFMLHAIFGAVLGGVYGLQRPNAVIQA